MVKELRELEMAYCYENPEYFIENYVKIENKDSEDLVQPFTLWPKQKEALRSIHENRLNIILKARQLGITWLALAYATYTGLFREGRLIICLSRTEDGAKELIRRLSFIFANLPFVYEEGKAPVGWSGATFRATALELRINFQSGNISTFAAYPSSPSTARGLTADLLILDEWAFQQFAEDIWKAVYPTINRPTGGKVIGLSTIERGTLFEDLYTNDDNGFNHLFLPWDTDPSRDAQWYQKSLQVFGKAKMFQEYPSTVEEALTIPGGAFFEEVKQSTHLTEEGFIGSVRRYVCIDYGLDMLSAHWVAVDTKNRALIYREYDSPNKTIGEACEILKDLSKDEEIDLFLAPPDLWNRSQESGKSRAQLFSEYGVTLVKTSNDFASGCAAMKEWLHVDEVKRVPALRMLKEAAPNLFKCLQKIQRDKFRPNVYAKDPHDLTHDCDSLRCFCVWWTSPAQALDDRKRKRWEPDLLEDYQHADEKTKERMIQKYGVPM